MKNAEVRYVDISVDDSFGYDLAGDPIPMDGYAFTVVEQYPDGISFQEDEVGAFIDEYMQRKPIRIVHRSNYGLSDAMQQLADDCPPADHQALLDKLDEATP